MWALFNIDKEGVGDWLYKDPSYLRTTLGVKYSFWGGLETQCPFVCTFRQQKAIFKTKKINQAFGNVSKHAFSKKLCFEMQRIGPKRADRFDELLQS